MVWFGWGPFLFRFWSESYRFIVFVYRCIIFKMSFKFYIAAKVAYIFSELSFVEMFRCWDEIGVIT